MERGDQTSVAYDCKFIERAFEMKTNEAGLRFCLKSRGFSSLHQLEKKEKTRADLLLKVLPQMT